MSIETLKISLAQKILAITDNALLNKVKLLIENENIIGYDAKGKLFFEREYIKEMDKSINAIKNGTATLYITDEVRNNIIDANNLVQ